jgi:hypothetical protein
MVRFFARLGGDQKARGQREEGAVSQSTEMMTPLAVLPVLGGVCLGRLLDHVDFSADRLEFCTLHVTGTRSGPIPRGVWAGAPNNHGVAVPGV